MCDGKECKERKEYITEERKEKIIKLINKVSGMNYHQGCFASLSNQYPSDFNQMGRDIGNVGEEIRVLLNIT